MSEERDENMAEENLRKNPFCVISREANEHGWRDLQMNNTWRANPYGESYAIIPDEMAEAIMKTQGYCDIELNEEGTEVTSFTPIDIPVFPEAEETPSEFDVLEAQVTYTAMMTDTLLEV